MGSGNYSVGTGLRGSAGAGGTLGGRKIPAPTERGPPRLAGSGGFLFDGVRGGWLLFRWIPFGRLSFFRFPLCWFRLRWLGGGFALGGDRRAEGFEHRFEIGG